MDGEPEADRRLRNRQEVKLINVRSKNGRFLLKGTASNDNSELYQIALPRLPGLIVQLVVNDTVFVIEEDLRGIKLSRRRRKGNEPAVEERLPDDARSYPVGRIEESGTSEDREVSKVHFQITVLPDRMIIVTVGKNDARGMITRARLPRGDARKKVLAVLKEWKQVLLERLKAYDGTGKTLEAFLNDHKDPADEMLLFDPEDSRARHFMQKISPGEIRVDRIRKVQKFNTGMRSTDEGQKTGYVILVIQYDDRRFFWLKESELALH